MEDKVDQILVQRQRIRDLKPKVDQEAKKYTKELARIESLVTDITRVGAKYDILRPEWKKEGRGQLVIGTIWLALFAVTIVMILSKGGDGAEEIRNGSIGEWLVVGGIALAPLCLGFLKRLSAWLKCRKVEKEYIGLHKLREEIQAIKNSMPSLISLQDQLSQAEQELDRLTAYEGEDWDLSVFYATSEDVARMEKDALDLFMVLPYAKNELKTNNWIVKTMIQIDDPRNPFWYKRDSLIRGYNKLVITGSWKLRVVQAVMSSLDSVITSYALFDGNRPKRTFEEAMGGIREPQTDEERTFRMYASMASDAINKAVASDYALRKLNGTLDEMFQRFR